MTTLTADAKKRKAMPIARGVLDYFPDAMAAVAEVSRIGNEQHNPGQPMHWAREKSTDHADCIVRHLIERGTVDTDGSRHAAKVAWRALALLQTEIEEAAELEQLHRPTPAELREIFSQPVADTCEPVQIGSRTVMLMTADEVLRRIKQMDGYEFKESGA